MDVKDCVVEVEDECTVDSLAKCGTVERIVVKTGTINFVNLVVVNKGLGAVVAVTLGRIFNTGTVVALAAPRLARRSTPPTLPVLLTVPAVLGTPGSLAVGNVVADAVVTVEVVNTFPLDVVLATGRVVEGGNVVVVRGSEGLCTTGND